MLLLKEFPKNLTTQEAKANIKKFGKNILPEKKAKSFIQLVIKQVKSPLIIFLLIVAIGTAILGEIPDTVVILIVVTVNAVMGITQERKSQAAIQSLKSFLAEKCKVYRDNELKVVDIANITIDDLVYIESGDKIPADGIIENAIKFQVNESQITGESFPVAKDKEQQVFMGTVAVTGRAYIRITAIGSSTELGKISGEIAKKEKDTTPLEDRFASLTKKIMVIVAILIVLGLFVGLANGYPGEDLLKSLIALAISITPEGLPVVVAITLAIGVFRMSKYKAIIRNLASASTLAATDIICTDKTGTLTVGHIYMEKFIPFGKEADYGVNELALAALCNDADLKSGTGDPLDLAILSFVKTTVNIDRLNKDYDRIDEIPFDSELKFQATLNKFNQDNIIIVKGAPDILIKKLHKLYPKKHIQEIETLLEDLTLQGLRLILLAFKRTDKNELKQSDISDLIPLGFLCFSDPVRPNVKSSLETCQKSGIKVMMVTGDYKNTAVAAARIAGFEVNDENVVSGEELLHITPEALADVKVVYRAKPEDKSKIINILTKLKHIVAMTGDGVNDAPALVRAHIGIAMGKGGTQAAIESSDMVLLDNKFTTIIHGIEQARVIFENIKKVITYLVITSLAETILILGAVFFKLPLPLLGVQLLWLNLVTDGLLDITLATEKQDGNVIKYSPKRYQGPIVDKKMLLLVLRIGTYLALGALLFFVRIKDAYPIEYVRTAILTFIAVPQWFIALSMRSFDTSLFKLGFFSNKYLNWAIAAQIVLLVAAVYTPFMDKILHTVPLDGSVWVITVLFGITILIMEEIRKSKIIQKIWKQNVKIAKLSSQSK